MIPSCRMLDYPERPDRQMCRLHLSTLDKMDVRRPEFGDVDKRLEEV